MTLGFATILLLVTAVGGLLMWADSWSERANGEMSAQYRKMLLAREIVSDTDRVFLDLWTAIETKDANAAGALKADLGGRQRAWQAKLDELKAALVTATGRQLFGDLSEPATQSWEICRRSLSLAVLGKTAEARESLSAENTAIRARTNRAAATFMAWREKRIGDARAGLSAMRTKVAWLSLCCGLSVLLLAVLVARNLIRSVVRPIVAMVEVANAVSKGDLAAEVPPALLSRRDETGELAVAMSRLTQGLRTSLLDVINCVGTIGAGSEGLKAISERLTNGAQTTFERTQSAAVAAEESSANVTSVAASMEQASANLTSVATAAEEMSATVGEIAANSERARAISKQATDETRAIAEIMQQLGQSAQEIGKVTETITGISAQTNLLALNATIEAARAGSAGKGFAVVANEIKELAQQTSAATEDIKAKIVSVQTSARGAIATIEKAANVIQEVEAAVANIAAAIEQQAAVTKDVAGNVAQASAGIQEANERVAQTATVSQAMAEDIAKIGTEGSAMNRDGMIVRADTGGLRNVVERLMQVTSKFKVGEGVVDFAAIKKGHIAWRAKLVEMFEGRKKFTEDEVKNHRICAFGKWYESTEGQRFNVLPGYQKVGAHHEAFHRLVAEIVRLWNGREERDALASYEKLITHTGELFVMLDELAVDAARLQAVGSIAQRDYLQ